MNTWQCSVCGAVNDISLSSCSACECGLKRRKEVNTPIWMNRWLWITLFSIAWVGSLIGTVGNAIPYGGGGDMVRLWAALTWIAVFWIGFQLFRALISLIWRPSQTHPVNAAVQPSTEPMIMCTYCNTETPVQNLSCIWCNKRLNDAL